MLVSSIGYFDVSKVSYAENSVSKTNLTEGFGHFKEKKTNSCRNDLKLFSDFINSFKSFFLKENSQESSKYLSLIA